MLRISLLIFMMLPVIALAHFIAFPQETRCMLIGFSDFKKTSNIYFRKSASAATIQNIKNLKLAAEKKATAFWGANGVLKYEIIFCDNGKDYNNYSVAGTPAATQFKFGPFIVLSNIGLDTSILAHEISHTVLYNNIGWYRNNFNILIN